ncbi:MAG: DMT family transporter [bacterium]|nr:DMT family transporter [bacterium]
MTRGMAWMIASVFLCSLGGAQLKVLTQTMESSLEIIVLRSFASIPLLIPFVLKMGVRRAFETVSLSHHLLRSLAFIGSIVLMTESFRTVSLFSTTAVFYISPVLSVALAVIFFKEKVKPKILIAISSGVLGVFVMMRPGSELLSVGGLYALGAALAFSVTKLLSKKVRNDPISSHILYYTIVSLFLGSVWFLFSPPSMPSLNTWGIIFLSAVIQMGGFICLVCALESENVVVLSPLDYSGLVFSGIFGYLFFQDGVTVSVLIGGGIIVLGNLQMIRKDAPTSQNSLKKSTS